MSTLTNNNTALIIIDVQNDFCTGGSLAIENGEDVVAPINTLSTQANTVILTQDWHPKNHTSFANNQEGKAPFETITMPYGEQTLWPTHCVMGTEGAQFRGDLNTDKAQMIVRKGFRSEIDSYSSFFENDHKTPTGLFGYLQQRQITDVILTGLATDFCVAFSAIDAAKLGLKTTVVLNACKGINLEGSYENAIKAMQSAGVNIVDNL